MRDQRPTLDFFGRIKWKRRYSERSVFGLRVCKYAGHCLPTLRGSDSGGDTTFGTAVMSTEGAISGEMTKRRAFWVARRLS